MEEEAWMVGALISVQLVQSANVGVRTAERS